MKIYLIRFSSDDQGTKGILIAPGFTCCTLELPWKENKCNISCIPESIYNAYIRWSNRFGTTYYLKDVPGRSFILIHKGNLAGDKTKGFKTDVEGCILLGNRFGLLNNQLAVLNSRITFDNFMHHTDNEILQIEIINNWKRKI